MPQPLRPTIPESLNTFPHILLAYFKLLQLEKATDYSHSNREVCEEKLVHARILGYLIREGPSTNAKERVAQQVNSCSNNDEMDRLSKMYYDYYVRACESSSLAVIAFILMVS
jgi:hypothetical protein